MSIVDGATITASPTQWGKCHKTPQAARDDGGESLKGRVLQLRTPIAPPAKTLSGHFPHGWGKAWRSMSAGGTLA